MTSLSYLARVAQQGNYSPATFGWGAHLDPTTEGNEHLIEPFGFNGVAFPGGVHRDAHAVFRNFLVDLVPHLPGGLVAGECGCYVNRSIRGSSSRSFHSWGIAIDINWTQNPLGAPSRYGHPHVVPAIAGQIAERWGLQWGGGWSGRRDSMHVECHLSPHHAHRVKPRTFRTVRFRTAARKGHAR